MTVDLPLDERLRQLGVRTSVARAAAGASRPTGVNTDPIRAIEADVIVWPEHATEVTEVLRAAQTDRAQVSVIGAGTRVRRQRFGARLGARVALCTRRMVSVLHLEPTACYVHAQAGITLDDLEAALAHHELTLGPYVRLVGDSTLGGLLAAPRAEAYSPATGSLSDNCFALSAVAPDGTQIQGRPAPRAATGPNLARLQIGASGHLGVITSATIRVFRAPEACCSLACSFGDASAAHRAARELICAELRPSALQVLIGPGTTTADNAPGTSAVAQLLVELTGTSLQVQRQRDVVTGLAARFDAFPPEDLAGWPQQDGVAGETPRPLSHAQLAELLTVPASPQIPCLTFRLDQFTLHGANAWLPDCVLSALGSALPNHNPTARPAQVATEVSAAAKLLIQSFDPHQTMLVGSQET